MNLFLEVRTTGHGSYKLTTTYYNKTISIHSNDSSLIDEIKQENERKSNAAKKRAIAMIIARHRAQQ